MSTTIQLEPAASDIWIGDWCPQCNPDGCYADSPVRMATYTAPVRIAWDGGKFLTCHYQCSRPRCGHRWMNDLWPASCKGLDPRKKAA